MRIVVQLGFRRNVREGQLVTVTLNGRELDRDRLTGQYLTDMAHRYTNCWYLAELECDNGDVLIIEAKTGVRQKGPDERRSFRMTFVANDKANVRTVEVPNVGMYGYPLLKGRVDEIAKVSADDERRQSAEAMLDDEDF